MPNDPHVPTRLEIVIDTDDSNPDLLFLWAAAQAVKLVEDLRRTGTGAELISVDIDGERHYRW